MCILMDLVKIGLLDILKYSQCLLNTEFCKWGILEYCKNGRGVTYILDSVRGAECPLTIYYTLLKSCLSKNNRKDFFMNVKHR